MGTAGSVDDTAEPIPGIPTGTVTFLFTDVARSTILWEQHPDEMAVALGRHDRVVRQSIESHDGYVFSLAGDQFVAAFHRVADALAAAIDAQRRIVAEPWPEPTPIEVRIGIHVGEAEERDNDYFGPVLNRTARIVSAIHGGQIVLSDTAASLIDRDGLTDLGEHRLKDLAAPERLWQFGTQSFAPLRTLRDDRHNLPVERTTLVGRSEQVSNLVGDVGTNRLVSLLGIGGSGKTRLATAVAAELADTFSDGVWFVDLVPTNDVESVVVAIASATGLQLAGNDLLDALAAQAEARHMLFVLDNCEHVTDDVADVVDLVLERTHRIHIIATSREPLDLPDEFQYRVAPLTVAPTTASPAIRLFYSSAARVGAEPSPGDVDLVAEICERLDGLPLSIELAAAQLRQLQLGELAERLDRRFELLTRGRNNRRRRRQASLLEVLDDSWSLLNADEQQLLRHLAAFPAAFVLADVEEMVGSHRSVGRDLGGLIDRGLVSGDGHGSNRLLETVKLFVRERWHDDTTEGFDADDFVEAHTRWVLDYVHHNGVENNYQSVSLAGWAIRHYDDHRAVEDRLVAADRLDELADLIGGLRWAYSRETGQRATAFIERIERYIATLELSTSQSASLHLAAAGAARAARDRTWLAHGAEEAVRLYRLEGPSPELVVALIVASFSLVLKQPEQAFANLDEARAIATDVGAATLVDATLAYRAHYAAMIGGVDDVREILAELEPRLADGLIDNTTIMTLQAKMVANLISDPPTAQAAAKKCVSHAATLGLDNDWWMHLYLATAAAAVGDVADMRRHLADGADMLRQSGTNGLPDLLLPYVALARVIGQHGRAQRWITAVRHANSRPGTGVVIALYRHLRTAIGLQSENPLADVGIDDIHREVVEWAAALE